MAYDALLRTPRRHSWRSDPVGGLVTKEWQPAMGGAPDAAFRRALCTMICLANYLVNRGKETNTSIIDKCLRGVYICDLQFMVILSSPAEVENLDPSVLPLPSCAGKPGSHNTNICEGSESGTKPVPVALLFQQGPLTGRSGA